MKHIIRSWPWLAAGLVAGLICATYLIAQVGQDEALPVAAEDGQRLLNLLAAREYQAALEILHRHGVAEETLLTMAEKMTLPPSRVALAEPFLRGTVLLPLEGRADEVQTRVLAATAMGHERLFWMVQSLESNWEARYDAQLELFPVSPIAVLDLTLNDANIIEFFRWYDRYADHLHSVVINWTPLSNHVLWGGYDQVNHTLSGLYQLIKARKPDAFVWLFVVKRDDGNDIQWLRAMTFQPDGLIIGNLRQFHSPFQHTRERYLQVVGPDTPMVVANFQGYTPALVEKGAKLTTAEDMPDSPQRMAARFEALGELGEIGKVVGPNLDRMGVKLESLGYRGLTANWLLLEALQHQNMARNR